MRKNKISIALKSWRSLNSVITQLTERELDRALSLERSNDRRPNVIKRLHQRLNRLRVNRELKQLLRRP